MASPRASRTLSIVIRSNTCWKKPVTTVRMRSGRQLHVPGPELRLGGPPGGEPDIPAAGQHTAAVLAELGYGEPDVARLVAGGIVETERA